MANYNNSNMEKAEDVFVIKQPDPSIVTGKQSFDT